MSQILQTSILLVIFAHSGDCLDTCGCGPSSCKPMNNSQYCLLEYTRCADLFTQIHLRNIFDGTHPSSIFPEQCLSSFRSLRNRFVDSWLWAMETATQRCPAYQDRDWEQHKAVIPIVCEEIEKYKELETCSPSQFFSVCAVLSPSKCGSFGAYARCLEQVVSYYCDSILGSWYKNLLTTYFEAEKGCGTTYHITHSTTTVRGPTWSSTDATSSESSTSWPVGLLAGIFGGIAVAIFLFVACICYCCRKKPRPASATTTVTTHQTQASYPNAHYITGAETTTQQADSMAPPSYTDIQWQPSPVAAVPITEPSAPPLDVFHTEPVLDESSLQIEAEQPPPRYSSLYNVAEQ